MSGETPANYAFLPWFRSGLSAIITEDSQTGLHTRVSIQTTIEATGGSKRSVSANIMGPSDITGFDTRLIIRTDPSPDTRDFETPLFPCVEFERPDFPWLLSPQGAASTAGSQILPWLALVVIKKEEVTLSPQKSDGLTKLTVAANLLPEIDSSWAHVQVAAYEPGESLMQIFREEPERMCSRLLSPIQLEKLTNYVACLVPTYEAGRLAGLKQYSPEQHSELGRALAWDTNSSDNVSLPVYYHFAFATGPSGDFESLARMLLPRPLGTQVGIKLLNIRDPGGSVGPLDEDHPMATVAFSGALKAPQTITEPVVSDPNGTWQAYTDQLSDRLQEGVGLTADSVAPPLYGRWHAPAFSAPENDSEQPVWLSELNLRPWRRAASGLGAKIVKKNQRNLMSAAWNQVLGIDEYNQFNQRLTISGRSNTSTWRRWYSRLSWHSFVRIATPASSRLLNPDDSTSLRTELKRSSFRSGLALPAFRKLARKRGPLAKRFNRINTLANPLLPEPNGFEGSYDLVIDPNYRPAGARPEPDGMISLDAVTDAMNLPEAQSPLKFAKLTESALNSIANDSALDNHNFVRTRSSRGNSSWISDPAASLETAPADGFTAPLKAIALAAALVQRRRNLQLTLERPSKSGTPLDPTSSWQSRYLIGLLPATLQQKRLQSSVRMPETARLRSEKSHSRTLVGPTFEYPMYRALRNLNPEYLLPGADGIPANTVGLLETNPEFIESFMIGLNHEMARELLWEQYPCDLGATFFYQFWDKADSDDDDTRDIYDINTWLRTSSLGTHMTLQNGEGQVVLLLRGELLFRYPRTLIYASKAQWLDESGGKRTINDSSEERYPIFRATMGTDIVCLGFDLTVDEAVGTEDGLGWFFVLAEPSTEPRFGLDLSPDDQGGQSSDGLSSWDDLHWGHVTPSGSISDIRYLSLAGNGDLYPDGSGRRIDEIQWGRNSAHMARIFMQRPYRVAIHADDMVVGT